MAVILSGNKDQLRKRALIERSQLKNEIIEELSKKISENLIRNFNLEKLNVHLFYPISNKKEVNTWHIHNKLSHSVKIFTSAYNNNSEEWECVSFNPNTEFRKGKFNVPYPIKHQKELFEDINVILIPLLVFDGNGHRIGYGKGIYDSILNSTKKTCIKVGLSIMECSNVLIDFQDHDIALDYCQTPSVLHNFKLNP